MAENRVYAGESQEDQFTSAVEKYTSKVPSSFFLGLAIASIAGSLILKMTNRDENAIFVGQWVAPFLILGNYNKMVKQHGSDAVTRRSAA
jgi:hypothetical protein